MHEKHYSICVRNCSIFSRLITMGAKRGGFDSSGPIPVDRYFSQYLQSTESVTSAGAGALLIPSMRPERGKIYITTIRLAIVLDDQRITPLWSKLWGEINNVRIKKSLIAATAFLGGSDFDIGIDSTKAMASDIERVWLHMSSNEPALEMCAPDFLPSVDVRCSACRSQISPGASLCRMCKRSVSWPKVLDVLSLAQQDPETLMPSLYPDGKSTQREVVIQGLSTIIVGAYCHQKYDFIDKAELLVESIRQKTGGQPEVFGLLPSMTGVGDQESNSEFWSMICDIPSRFSRD
jgi:hypothetical protein